MTDSDRLLLARKIAAAACELHGDTDDYCKFMREGAYDAHTIIVATLAAIKAGERASDQDKSNVVGIAA